MKHREYFDSMADRWDEITRVDALKLEEIIDRAEIGSGQRILDVGTGTGVILPFLLSRVGNGEIYALDISERMLERARLKHPEDNIVFLRADAASIPLPGDFFDRVICFSVFPHFTDKEATTRELARVLKPNGQLCILHAESRRSINELHRRIGGVVGNDRLLEAAEMRALVESSGLVLRELIDGEDVYFLKAEKQG